MSENDKGNGTSGSGLQDSQSGGGSGDFGGNMDQRQGGAALGGGAGEADFDQAGGSSGTGGYGNAQNQQNHQGQGQSGAGARDPNQSRGERFDELQGGGRGPGSIADDGDGDPAANLELDAAVGEFLAQDAGEDGRRSGTEEEDAQS